MKEIIFSASLCIICCECVLDSFSGGDSKIHPQHMILGRINGNEDKTTNGPVNYRPAITTKSRFAKFLRLGNASIYHLSDEKKSK